jgi:membrane dipeptidase
MNRRAFLAAAALVTVRRTVRLEAAARQPQRSAPVIDGLGEIHPDYPDSLLDEILATGMRCCVVTVGNPALQGAEAFDDMRREIEAYERHIARKPDRLSRVRATSDIDASVGKRTLGLLYYTQNASPLQDRAERLDDLYRLGVRIVQLTYNTRNLLGDGCLERTDSGLSRFGVEVIERMNAARMLVDVSHCGGATTLDGIRLSKAPVAITHAGCKAVYDHPRNKTDEALKLMADRGGAIGIFQINPYLGAKERNTLDDYLRHVDHAVKVAGIDHVGIGSDREHRTIPDTEEEKQKLIEELSRLRPVTAATFRWPFFIGELNHPRRMETIAAALSTRGYTAAQVEKIMGGNFYRLFRETVG